MNRTCCFCGSTPLTLEHVYPDWLTGYFKKGTVGINEVSGDGVARTWNKAIFQHKAKIVCAVCNNGWMSSLENDAKPIIEKMIFSDEAMTIDATQQNTLALWVQKTTLILNKSTGGKFNIPDSFYKELYQTKKPLGSIAINIGWRLLARGTKDEPLATFEIKQIGNMQVKLDDREKIENDIASGKFAWSASIGLGKVVFQMFGHNLNGLVELVGVDERLLTQINPFAKDLSWPLEWPIEALHDLEAMRKAF